MRLAASLIVRDELGRYLATSVAHLLEFCDEVLVWDDGSVDGTREYLLGLADPRVRVQSDHRSRFFEHEGAARQRLLDWTLARRPTHVLTLDADELVSDGSELRRLVEARAAQPVWTLSMEEVWELDGDCLCVRVDGGWRPHPVPAVWRADAPGPMLIRDAALACGREPIAARSYPRPLASGIELLHFGWACEADRVARHQRYVEADGGRYHAGSHLDSIMWPPERVRLEGREWPSALARYRDAVAGRADPVRPTV